MIFLGVCECAFMLCIYKTSEKNSFVCIWNIDDDGYCFVLFFFCFSSSYMGSPIAAMCTCSYISRTCIHTDILCDLWYDECCCGQRPHDMTWKWNRINILWTTQFQAMIMEIPSHAHRSRINWGDKHVCRACAHRSIPAGNVDRAIKFNAYITHTLCLASTTGKIYLWKKSLSLRAFTLCCIQFWYNKRGPNRCDCHGLSISISGWHSRRNLD